MFTRKKFQAMFTRKKVQAMFTRKKVQAMFTRKKFQKTSRNLFTDLTLQARNKAMNNFRFEI